MEYAIGLAVVLTGLSAIVLTLFLVNRVLLNAIGKGLGW